MKVKKPILLIQDNFGGLDQNQGQNPIVHCKFVGLPPLFGAKNASKSLKMPMFPYKMDTLYIFLTLTVFSSWLTHVKDILTCGGLVAQCIEREKSSVVVHGSEGMDITLCVTSIAQVILNPDCRTVRY